MVTMQSRIPLALGTALAALPGLAAPVSAAANTAVTVASARTYRGPTVTIGYAVATVTISISGRRITAVNANLIPHYPYSRELDSRAVPILRHEALQVQRAAAVHKVTGASQTSQAFVDSLAAAMRAAHLPGA
jgi:uncharacterized protein with FMN-binding domain